MRKLLVNEWTDRDELVGKLFTFMGRALVQGRDMPRPVREMMRDGFKDAMDWAAAAAHPNACIHEVCAVAATLLVYGRHWDTPPEWHDVPTNDGRTLGEWSDDTRTQVVSWLMGSAGDNVITMLNREKVSENMERIDFDY